MPTIVQKNNRYLSRVRIAGHKGISSTFDSYHEALKWGLQMEAEFKRATPERQRLLEVAESLGLGDLELLAATQVLHCHHATCGLVLATDGDEADPGLVGVLQLLRQLARLQLRFDVQTGRAQALQALAEDAAAPALLLIQAPSAVVSSAQVARALLPLAQLALPMIPIALAITASTPAVAPDLLTLKLPPRVTVSLIPRRYHPDAAGSLF